MTMTCRCVAHPGVLAKAWGVLAEKWGVLADVLSSRAAAPVRWLLRTVALGRGGRPWGAAGFPEQT